MAVLGYLKLNWGDIMEGWSLKFTLLLTVQMTMVLAKKKDIEMLEQSNSDESIENILYYKDCKHKQKTTTATPLRMQEPPKPACPCPRMCCSMCCDCESPQMSFMNQQMSPLQQQQGIRMASLPMMATDGQNSMFGAGPINGLNGPFQPVPEQHKRRRIKPLIQTPNGRRSFGFTKEDIKSLISKDEDIKHILDNLVKVAMLKVNGKDGQDVLQPKDIEEAVVEAASAEDYVQ